MHGTGAEPEFTPVFDERTDRDFLPTATARLKFDNGIAGAPRLHQIDPPARRSAISIRRVTLTMSNNPFVQSAGSAGNPDLRGAEIEQL